MQLNKSLNHKYKSSLPAGTAKQRWFWKETKFEELRVVSIMNKDKKLNSKSRVNYVSITWENKSKFICTFIK